MRRRSPCSFIVVHVDRPVRALATMPSSRNSSASTSLGFARTAPSARKTTRNTSARAAYVVGKDGVIKYVERTPTPKDLPNFEAIKAALAK